MHPFETAIVLGKEVNGLHSLSDWSFSDDYAGANFFNALESTKYISLATFRKSGAQVPTPVWFALHNGTIYVETFPSAGKLKRIHRTSRVTLAPCTLSGKVTGAATEGKARIIADDREIATAEATLSRKYGLTRKLYNGTLDLMRTLRHRPKVEQKYIAIVPVE